MFIRAYLRASTTEQDATRAQFELKEFVKSQNQRIASFYIENVSGVNIEREELSRLIDDSESGDILLIEKMDRLTRLPYNEWKSLKARINDKGIQIVVIDQPMTYATLRPSNQAQSAIQQALTEFMLDLGAAMARDDYETRQKRQKEGIKKAQAEGRFKGKQINKELHKNIITMVKSGMSYTQIQQAIGCSRATIARVKKLTYITDVNC